MTRTRTDLERLWDSALCLERRGAHENPLPPLLFVTDPDRTPDPTRIARRLPSGSGVVFRAFGRSDALDTALDLAELAAERGLTLLIGADAALAEACEADGLHLPERMIGALPRLRTRNPAWLITTAAHSVRAGRRAAALGADAVLVSPVFPSRSPSARGSLGLMRFRSMARAIPCPVYALGGVNAQTARRLETSGAAGLAAVEGLAAD